MSKNKNKKVKKGAEPHPTLFVFDGTVRWYKEGSMLELQSKVTLEEWEMITADTVHYKVFVECLKNVACPILEEPWTKEDDWFRVQMEIAVSRIRNLDPLLVAKYDQKKIMQEYKKKAQKNAQLLKAEINQLKQQRAQLLDNMLDDEDTTKVSDL